MARTTVELHGDVELIRKLNSLPGRVQRGAFRTAARKSGKILASEQKRRAPVESGQTKRAIKVRAIKRTRTGVGVTVGTSQKDYTGDQFYAAFVEYGHKQGHRRLGANRVFIPARPFLRPAFDAKIGEMEAVYRSELKVQLEKG